MIERGLTVVVGILALGGGAWAQPARPPARAPTPPAPAAAPVAAPTPTAAPTSAPSPAPQQTTATFGDWVMRCTAGEAGQLCELVQGVQRDDKPVAQMAIGRPGKGMPMQFTLLIAPSVAFAAPPTLSPAKESDGAPLRLEWRRCIPGACMADTPLTDDALRTIKNWSEAGRVTFLDAAGRPTALPVSPRGLGPALDALALSDG